MLNGFVSGAAHAARREAVRCAFARVQKKVDARPEVQPAYRAAALQLEVGRGALPLLLFLAFACTQKT